MIAIEKEIAYKPIPENNFKYKIVNSINYDDIQNKYKLKLFDHYAKNKVESLVLIDNNKIAGFIRWTLDKEFIDLKKLGVRIKENEAYMFDLWIFPHYRGIKTLNIITRAAHNHLYERGIKKFYGYYFADNLQALWWHRAIMKSKDIKKVSSSKFIFLEYINGKLY